MMEKDPIAILQAVALIDTTVKQGSDEMGANIEEQLSEVSQKASFSLLLDETTSVNNTLLMVYIR